MQERYKILFIHIKAAIVGVMNEQFSSLPCLQHPAIGPHPESEKSCLQLAPYLFKIRFNITLHLYPDFLSGLSSADFLSNPITGLDRPRGFQEVKVPRLRDNGTGWW